MKLTYDYWNQFCDFSTIQQFHFDISNIGHGFCQIQKLDKSIFKNAALKVLKKRPHCEQHA